jgi:hypothetical protein
MRNGDAQLCFFFIQIILYLSKLCERHDLYRVRTDVTPDSCYMLDGRLLLAHICDQVFTTPQLIGLLLQTVQSKADPGKIIAHVIEPETIIT